MKKTLHGESMSTTYMIVCENHKEFTDACNRRAGGYGPLGDEEDQTLTPFIIAHCDCRVKIINEHSAFYEKNILVFPSEYHEWTGKNLATEIEKAIEEKRWK